MDINKINRNAINSYKAFSNSVNPANAADNTKVTDSADDKLKSGSNFDTVEIDFTQSLNSAKAIIASRLSAEANISEIRRLQEEYSGDDCPVPAEEIARSILMD